MHIADMLSTSLKGVAENGLRTFLTTLGIIIGVASVISVLALGNGARVKVDRQFRSLGSDEVNISARNKIDDGETVLFGEKLSYSDGLEMVDNVPLVDRIDLSVGGSVKIRRERILLEASLNGAIAHLLATWASAKELVPSYFMDDGILSGRDYIEYGRFFSPFEVAACAPVCVLGNVAAEFLFGGDEPVGQTVWISRQRFQVIGVLYEIKYTDSEKNLRRNPNKDLVIVPISSAIGLLFHEEPSVSITAHVTDEGRILHYLIYPFP